MSRPLEFPAYFTGGPHGGETMYIGGAPSSFLFRVPADPLYPWLPERDLDPTFLMRRQQADEYIRHGAVLLYEYRGRV
jgi:hypothetical protein